MLNCLTNIRDAATMERDARQLLKKYHAGTCTEEERLIVEDWYLQWQKDAPGLEGQEQQSVKEHVWNRIMKQHKKRYMLRLIGAAASVAFFFFFAAVFLHVGSDGPGLQTKESLLVADPSTRVQDVKPGGNKAMLMLSDGRTVVLDEMADGAITQIAGMTITKTANGQLIYEMDAAQSVADATGYIPKFNQITTPRGGQYQIILPDGTNVWLNSASSLKYPVRFDEAERRVELTGEAYFEVNTKTSPSGDKIPFFVEAGAQTIEVLGTQFNINSYTDEAVVKTTLLEGSVRISLNTSVKQRITSEKAAQDVILRPNQQAILNGNAIDVVKVKAAESIAWKEGYFSFNGADLATVMRQLARWYDVEVVYEGAIPAGTYSGKVYRNMTLSKVLEILTYAEVKFRISGKQLIILSP